MSAALLGWLRNNLIPAFFALTFIIAWLLWLPLGLLAPQNTFLTLPGAWAPTISALMLIGLSEGREGIRTFLKKVIHWRVGFGWYVVVLFGIAAIAYLAIGIGALFGIAVPGISMPDGLRREAWIGALPIILLINIFLGGPLAEDIGWRGYILPKLRERMTALNASLLIGIIWALWHIPFFVFREWHPVVGNVPFLWFALLTTSWSVLFAWVYVNTESILMPVLFHAAINTTLGTLGVLGQPQGELLLMVLNTLLTWIAVGVVVILVGKDLQRNKQVHNT